MKKFSKILTLVLVFAAIIAAFAVVALADGETATDTSKVNTGDAILLTDFGGTVAIGKGELTNDYAVFGNQAVYYNALGTSGGYTFTPAEPIALGEYTKINLLVYNPEVTSTGLGMSLNYTGNLAGTLNSSQGSIVTHLEPGWQLISGTIKTSRVGTTLLSVNFGFTGYTLTGTEYPKNHAYTTAHHDGLAECSCEGTIEGHCGCAVGKYSHSNNLSKKSLYVAGIWLTKSAATAGDLISTPAIPNGQTDVKTNGLTYRINFSSDIVSSTLDNAITVYDGADQVTDGISFVKGNNYVDVCFADGILKSETTYTVKLGNKILGTDLSMTSGAEYTFTTAAPVLATVTTGAETKEFSSFAAAFDYAKTISGATIRIFDDVTDTKIVVDGDITVDTRKYDASGAPTGEAFVFTPTVTTTNGFTLKNDGNGIFKAEKVDADFMVMTATGDVSFYNASQFTSKLLSGGAGSTVKLLRDVEYNAGTVTVNLDNLTLDLNGYSLRKVCYYGDVYEATGDEEYPAEPNGTATASKTNVMFKGSTTPASYNNFKITSSSGTNGKIYIVSANTNSYYRDGVLERRDIVSHDRTQLYNSETTGTIVTFENLDLYCGVIATSANANRNVNYTLNRVNFYQFTPIASSDITGNSLFAFYLGGQNGMTVHATDCLFYLNASIPTNAASKGSTGLIRFSKALTEGYTTDVKFTNCDIIGAEGKYTVAMMNSQDKENIVFDGCRFHNIQSSSVGNAVSINGTIATSGTYPVAMSGFSKMTLTKAITISYTVPAVDMWTATDEAIQSVDFSFGTKQQNCTFTTITTKEIDVTFKDSTVTLIPGISDLYSDKSFRIYADTTSDALLNKIYVLCDADGNIYKSILGVTDKGVQFNWDNPLLTASTQTTSVGGVKDTFFNLGFLAGFRYNIYLPVTSRLTDISVDGFEKGQNTVYIDGTGYVVFSKLFGTAEGNDANVITATYKVDGVEYSQSWPINAVQYADMIISDPDTNYTTEIAAIGSMVKFIKAAVLTADPTVDTTDLDAIITKAGVSLEYGTYTDGNANALSPLSGIVTDVQYIVFNGVAAYRFTLAAEDTNIAFTVKGQTIGFTRDETDKRIITLDPMRVYNVVDPITITSGSTSASFTMLDYLTAMDSQGITGTELAKAIYEFGVSAEAYKNELCGIKSSFDYKVSGITNGDHIVVAAEPSRKIKVIDLGSSFDPDTLKNQTLTNVLKVVFKIDGKTVKEVTSAPFEFDLVFNKYGMHTLTVEVYDIDGFVSMCEIAYNALDDEFDDTFLSFEEDFDGDTDGSGLHGGSCSGTQSVVNNALQIGDGATKVISAFHPFGRSLSKENEVYYIDFDIKTNSTAYHTQFSIRGGYESGSSALLFELTNAFNKNQFYHIRIILDFYTNYATVFVDGEYYSRVSMYAVNKDGVEESTFTPQIMVNKRIVTLDNVNFASYGYQADLPEPTYSEDKPVVIFRFDDFGKYGTIGAFNKLAYLLEKYNSTGSYGLVGQWFEDQTEANRQTVINASEKFIEQGIEIFHHGYYHSTKEYNNNGGDPYDTQKENFGKTMDIAEQYFGVTLHSFGSPYNHAGDTAVRMIQENYPEITSFMNLYYATDGVATLPVFNNNCAIESETGIIDALAFIENFESKRGDDYLISLSHPGYWDDSELAQFELILRYLNASGVTYMTATEAAEDYTENFAKNKEYTIQGINEGDRIVSSYESTRRVRVIDPKSYDSTPVANKTAGVSYVSSVEFYLDGILLYTATEAPFEYMLPVGGVGTHTLKVVVNMTVGAKKTYERTYKVMEATKNDELSVEEDFSTSTDASAIHGGVCDAGLTQTVTDGVLQLTASGASYDMNMYRDIASLTTLDRIYFMEFDFAVDSNAYQMNLIVSRILSSNGADERDFLNVSRNYDYVQKSSKVWYNVKIMFDCGNDSAIVYVDGYEYRRVNLAYITNNFFRPELSINKKSVYLDNYKFYAYDLAEKEEVKTPTVILRFDDLKDSSLEEIERATEILNSYDINASIGVIGSALGSAELYQAIIDLYNGGAEIWHHGYTHDSKEFYGATAESAVESYRKTYELILQYCGIEITSLGGPYNNVDSTALKAIQEAFPSLKCVMDSSDKANVATVVNFYAITTFEGDTGTSAKINLEGFIEHFEKIQHNEYIVIYCHPGSWTNADFATFDQLVQYLIGEGVTFMTPSEAADDYIANH